jgi:Derlin-2/3
MLHISLVTCIATLLVVGSPCLVNAKSTSFQNLGATPLRNNEISLCKRTCRGVCTTSAIKSCLSIRGGSDYDSDFDSDTDFSDFDDDDLFGLDDTGDLEDDFSEQSTLSLALQAFQKSPPVTKLFLASSFFCSLMGYLQNKNDFPSYFLLDWKSTLTKFQFWRPVTAFLNFGPMGFGWLMTAHFVWTYMSTLERLNHNQPYEFWYMIFFGCSTMVMGYTFLNISPRFLGHNLSTFLVYVWSRYHEGLEVNMFDMFNTRAEMLPWFFLAQTFLLEGEFPILDLLGIVFGHVYHYLRSVGGIGRCPTFVKNWYEHGDDKFAKAVREEYKKISSDFEMQ